MEAHKLNNYSYADYLAIDRTIKENERLELIDGEILFMAGASAEHQDMVLEIASILKELTKKSDKRCFPRIAPFDLKLINGRDENVVQPDIMLFCGESEIPCAIFEVLSPSTAAKDRGSKKELYERFGVDDYFIVDISLKIIDAYRLENGKYYYLKGFSGKDQLPISCISAEVAMDSLFETTEKEEINNQ